MDAPITGLQLMPAIRHGIVFTVPMDIVVEDP